MDMVFILEHSVCCYRYSPNLRARTHFVNDRRLRPDKWSEEETENYGKEIPEDDEYIGYTGFYVRAFEEHVLKAKELGKTLMVIDFSFAVGVAIDELIKEAEKQGERWVVLSFFHSDESMQDLQYASPVEELIEDKLYWLEEMLVYPFIKTHEIDYNKTLHVDYLQELFQRHVPG
ncbi:MAG: hypothetical protein LBG84_07325 [Treponema sp.]|jgi:hypothetical protein|nr:hypothetical protein [Treponema sp.]